MVNVITRYEELKNSPEAHSFERVAELISEFTAPGRATFGDARVNVDGVQGPAWDNRFRFDDTSSIANTTLAGHIHTNSLPQHVSVATMSVKGDLGDDPEVAAWAQEVTEIVWSRLNDSNYYVETQAQIEDMVSFAVAPIWFLQEGKREDTQFLFRVPAPGEYYFELDQSGNVIEFYTLMKFKRASFDAYFKDKDLTDEAKEVLSGIELISEDEEIQIVHGVYLNPDPAKVKGTVAGPLRKYVEEYRFLTHGRRKLVIPADGYNEAPVYMGVYQRLAGSKYGVSPGVLSLNTVLTLNQAGALMLEAAEKSINPSILKARNEIYGDADLRAGGATTVKSKDSLTTLDLGNYAVSKDLYAFLIERVEKIFHMDRLQIKESSRMTATEVNVSIDLMNRILGPVSSSYDKTVTTGIFWRAYSIAAREGLLPEKPAQLDEANPEIELRFNGTLALAKMQSDVRIVQEFIGLMQVAAAFDTEIPMRIDTDFLIRYAQQKLNAPSKLVKDKDIADEEIRQEKEAANQAAALTAQAGAIKDVGQGVKALSDAQRG